MHSSQSRRPLSITIIALVYCIGAFATFAQTEWETLFLGFLVSGRTAFWVNCGTGALVLILGIGLWFLREWARRIAIGFESYNLIQMALSPLTVPMSKLNDLLDKMLRQIEVTPDIEGTARTLLFVLLTAGGTVSFIVTVLVLVFLLRNKEAFSDKGQSGT